MRRNTPPGGLVGVAVIGHRVSWSFSAPALTVRPEVLLVIVLHQTDHHPFCAIASVGGLVDSVPLCVVGLVIHGQDSASVF